MPKTIAVGYKRTKFREHKKRTSKLLNLNFNQLYYFYVVATEGSIKSATKKLHVTQPTISNQLKLLEDSLGYRLFERKNRRLEINEKGEALLQKAEKIFVLAEEMIHEANFGFTTKRDKIRIGALPSLPNIFIHKFCLKIWKDPSYSLSILQAPLQELVEKLNNNKIDLILTDSNYQKTRNRYRAFNLGYQRIVVVASPGFANLKKGFPKSLQGQAYLGFTRQGQLQDEIDNFFQNNSVKPDRIGEVDDITLARVVAEKGICFSILPLDAVREPLRQKQLIKIAELPELKANFWAITTKLGAQKVAIRKAIQYCQKNLVKS